VGEDLESLESVDWLFWVGCAGAYEDRAKKTTRAVAELLSIAGVSFGVLGKGETCTGDSARRAGNEFVFQGLAQQNVETFREFKVKQVVSTCAHCFNTLKNEYQEFGIELEVVHHTQLLNRLVREGRLTPVKDGAGAAKRSITYHDPCYIGRHNQVYEPPRELLEVLPGADFVEMERNSERSFCCGAGGARMWMEETIGERINLNRTTEAVGTGADQIAVGCPFCRVMLSDGLAALQDSGDARAEVEVLDVAQMLLASVKGESATRAAKTGATASAAGGGAATATLTREESPEDVATKAEPEPGDATQTEGTITETADAGPAAKASGGSSLFDVGGDDEAPEPEATAEPASTGGSLFDVGDEAETKAAPEPSKPTGGSLFDIDDDQAETKTAPEPSKPTVGSLFDIDEPDTSEVEVRGAPATSLETPDASTSTPSPEAAQGGSLFDIAEPDVKGEPAAQLEPAESAPSGSPEPVEASEPASEIPQGGSLFDIAEPEAKDEPAAQLEPDEPTPAEPAESPEPDAASGAVDPQALSKAATSAASDEPSEATEPSSAVPEAETEEDDAPDQSESDQSESGQPVPPGAAHQPKSDVDINEKGSLFDL